MRRLPSILLWLMVIIVILLSLINLWITAIGNKHHIRSNSERISQMEQEIATLIKQQPLDGRTPVKGVDYFDGKDGKDGTDGADGKDSVSTHVIEQQTVIKEIPINGKDGVDGRTPELSCNERENRWEIRYFGDTRWKLLNGKIIKCTTEMVLQ